MIRSPVTDRSIIALITLNITTKDKFYRFCHEIAQKCDELQG